ncbi:MAG: protease, partial [Candidatus Neomarinimicrobiota bacterium]
QRLRFVDISTGKITDVDQSDVWEIRDYSWSPDSKWIVYSKTEENDMNKIYVYSLAQNKKYEITEGWYSSYSPIFSDDGKYIVFISNREFKPIYSWTEWNHAYIDMAKIFLVLLTKDTVNPFKPENDEVQIKTSKSSGKSKKTKKQKDKEKLIKIDFDGIKDRIVSLPIKASRYRNISFVDNKIYYIRKGFADEKPILLMYDLNKKEEKQLGHASSYVISFDQKKMLVRIKDSYGIIDLPKSQVKIEKPLNLDNLVVKLNRKKEWEQIYNECWRQMREYFYAPNMHGVNWEDIKERYKPLVKYVNHRADLTYIIGEMIGELNVGHTYVGGGDYPKPKRIKLGLLGAQFEKDKKTGFFIIKKILKGVPWDKELKSPLMEPEVNAKEGEYVIAIDGIKTDTVNNIYKLLVGKADKQVKITLNSKPSTTGSREVIVVPIADESKLYYYNWVQRNIEIVNKKTNGKVGYVHIPDMSVEGLNEFVKHYYPQITKKALIVDVRGNGGGNVSPMIIERLRREIAMITIARNTKPSPNPDGMIWGPMVCLCDEYSASDGDIFTYRFKHYKLGKVIGKRTWGGVVGIRSSLPLVDGGQLYKPEFSRYDVEGKKWIIEGHGVEPDIYVDNDPALEYQGIDQQLNKAIEVILDELKTNEKQVPPPPPYPER